MKKLVLAFALLLTLALPACAQELDIGALVPIPMEAAYGKATPVDLYCGPTMGFYRDGEAVIDLGEPFVYFGQYDCWAMVAPGTPEAMGAIGWIESAAASLPEEPQLGFDDALPAMVEEDTYLTVTPFAKSPDPLCTLARGAQVLLLAQLGDWAYVQAEIGETPVRAFLPVRAIL